MGKRVIDKNTKWLGNGDEFIYIYTFPSCLENKNKKRGMVKMKVGMTTQASPIQRIHQQLGTSNHEKAILLYVFKTHDSKLFEKLLHNNLKSKGRKLKNSIGTEWFWIKENEIINLLKTTNNKIPKKPIVVADHQLPQINNSHLIIFGGIIGLIILLPTITIPIIGLFIVFKILEIIKII